MLGSNSKYFNSKQVYSYRLKPKFDNSKTSIKKKRQLKKQQKNFNYSPMICSVSEGNCETNHFKKLVLASSNLQTHKVISELNKVDYLDFFKF